MEQVRTTIRMPSKLLQDIEKIRDPLKHPTLSDFVRQAVEQYVIEIRRRDLQRECSHLADEEDLSTLAEADFDEYAKRMARAERGDL